MPIIKLSSLLKEIVEVTQEIDCEITGLALDSRLVSSGYLFFAYKGTHLDGRHFISDAITNGARIILAEADSDQVDYYLKDKLPIVRIPRLGQKVSQIAANFYGNPTKSLRIIGITGTNGKTSCSHFIASALQSLGIPCGIIGTLGSGIYGNIKLGSLTTPDAITLQATFAEFVQQGVQVVVMEVSSHSIDQGRINDILFEVGIFTNLTRDHLDYHGDMETYGAVKKRLFDNPLLQHAVINADDVFGQTLIQSLHSDKPVFAYSAYPSEQSIVPIVHANDVRLDMTGLHARVQTPWGSGELSVSLIGQFNLSNVLAVLTTLCVFRIPFNDALLSLRQLKPVPGRMQTVGGHNGPLIIVDYAHTPDALEKVLLALKPHCQGHLYCLFGCGGDRDKGKRPLMAKIAEQYADRVIVTDDNPRHEDPRQIVMDIMRGFMRPNDVIVQHDRSKAIEDIIQCAVSGDCVLIAGKGAETYQQIGDTKIPFSDVEKVNQFLSPLPLTGGGWGEQ